MSFAQVGASYFLCISMYATNVWVGRFIIMSLRENRNMKQERKNAILEHPNTPRVWHIYDYLQF